MIVELLLRLKSLHCWPVKWLKLAGFRLAQAYYLSTSMAPWGCEYICCRFIYACYCIISVFSMDVVCGIQFLLFWVFFVSVVVSCSDMQFLGIIPNSRSDADSTIELCRHWRCELNIELTTAGENRNESEQIWWHSSWVASQLSWIILNLFTFQICDQNLSAAIDNLINTGDANVTQLYSWVASAVWIGYEYFLWVDLKSFQYRRSLPDVTNFVSHKLRLSVNGQLKLGITRTSIPHMQDGEWCWWEALSVVRCEEWGDPDTWPDSAVHARYCVHAWHLSSTGLTELTSVVLTAHHYDHIAYFSSLANCQV